MGLELTLELRSERMLAGSRMVSGFTVRNGGTAAVELADVRWAMAPETFSPRSLWCTWSTAAAT